MSELYVCEYCHKPCEGHWIDNGIGDTEFWGVVKRDVAWEFLSECCNYPVKDREWGDDE